MIDKVKLEDLLSDIIIELDEIEAGAKTMAKMAADARRKIEDLDLEDGDE